MRRFGYALRQGLAVGLFGVPLWVLEDSLARRIQWGDAEIVPSFMGFFAFFAMPILGLITFFLALERFGEEDFAPEKTHYLLRHPMLIILGCTLLPLAMELYATGIPKNDYHFARLGIIAAGIYFGLLPFKWLVLDWEAKRFLPRRRHWWLLHSSRKSSV